MIKKFFAILFCTLMLGCSIRIYVQNNTAEEGSKMDVKLEIKADVPKQVKVDANADIDPSILPSIP